MSCSNTMNWSTVKELGRGYGIAETGKDHLFASQFLISLFDKRNFMFCSTRNQEKTLYLMSSPKNVAIQCCNIDVQVAWSKLRPLNRNVVFIRSYRCCVFYTSCQCLFYKSKGKFEVKNSRGVSIK